MLSNSHRICDSYDVSYEIARHTYEYTQTFLCGLVNGLVCDFKRATLAGLPH